MFSTGMKTLMEFLQAHTEHTFNSASLLVFHPVTIATVDATMPRRKQVLQNSPLTFIGHVAQMAARRSASS
jgi:hypothetical protein